jgi:hypothetical protein
MRTLSWELVQAEIARLEPTVNTTLGLVRKDIESYPHYNNNEEFLSQLLANLNWYVLQLGDLHAELEPLKIWTDKRYEIEKGLETVRIVRDERKPVNYANNAKYEAVKLFLDTMVTAGALCMRVQNARSSARGTNEAIRTRISLIKGAQRSS